MTVVYSVEIYYRIFFPTRWLGWCDSVLLHTVGKNVGKYRSNLILYQHRIRSCTSIEFNHLPVSNSILYQYRSRSCTSIEFDPVSVSFSVLYQYRIRSILVQDRFLTGAGLPMTHIEMVTNILSTGPFLKQIAYFYQISIRFFFAPHRTEPYGIII